MNALHELALHMGMKIKIASKLASFVNIDFPFSIAKDKLAKFCSMGLFDQFKCIDAPGTKLGQNLVQSWVQVCYGHT